MRIAFIFVILFTGTCGDGSRRTMTKFQKPPPTVAVIDEKKLNAMSILESQSVSEILNNLTQNYDKRLRPKYGGGPVKVNVSIHVITISAVSEVEMDYTLDMYLRQFWIDPRLAFTGTNQSLTIGIGMVDQIWVPDTFFPNEKQSLFHDATTHNSFLRIEPSGRVSRSMRLTVTANCPMKLEHFPLDSQNCSFEIESYGYGTLDIIYHWDKGNDSVTLEIAQLAQFTIGRKYIEERMIELSTGNYSRLSAYFMFDRSIGFYLIQIYLPSSLIVVISWVSFWLNREATQARVAIGVTTVLTMTTLMTSTNSQMPKVSYVKSIDIYLGTCFIIVFASLLEYAAVGYLMKRVRMQTEKRQNKTMASIPLIYQSNHLSRAGAGTGDKFWIENDNTVNSTTYYQQAEPAMDVRLERSGILPYDRAASKRSRGKSTGWGVWNPGRRAQGYDPVASPLLEMQQHRRSVSPKDGGPSPLLDATGGAYYSGPPTSTLRSPVSYLNDPSTTSFGEPRDGYPYASGAVDCDCDSTRYRDRRSARVIRLRTQYQKQTFKPSNIDKYSRIFFPLVFVSFHIIYWIVYLHAARWSHN